MLIFSDGRVIFADNESDLNILLHFVTKCCEKWKLKINMSKTKVFLLQKGMYKTSICIILYCYQTS